MSEVLHKGQELATTTNKHRNEITLASGVYERFWLHMIRRNLEETDKTFKVQDLLESNAYLQEKITLLTHKYILNSDDASQAILFLETWEQLLKEPGPQLASKQPR